MRSPIKRLAPLLAALALARVTSAATLTPLATPPTAVTSPPTSTPAVTPPTAETSPTGMLSPAPSLRSSPTVASSSPGPTALRRTALPTASPAAAANVDPTPVATPALQEGDASIGETPAAQPLPTSPPVGAVHAFRTPEREAPPAFMAPRAEPTEGADDTQLDEPLAEATRLPDRPYVGTVIFRAVANTDVEEFDLLVIYPRTAGDFVGTGDRVECRKTGDGILFADDHDDGMLRLIVSSKQPLTLPFDIVCRFSVDPTATLYSGLIAVNVLDVTAEGTRGDPSLLTVTVIAH
jgi:hypothetical protein